MTFNSISIIQQKVQSDFESLLATVMNPEAETGSIDAMERHLFKQLLQLGAQLLQLFVLVCAQRQRQEAVRTESGQRLPYHSLRRRNYISIFGKLTLIRPYYYQAGIGSASPLEASLGLGQGCYSDLLREWHEEVSVYLPYEKATHLLQRLLGIELSKRVLQQFVLEDATDVTTFYQQQAPPAAEDEAPILVVQADGKGIPLVQASHNSQRVRLKRGQARSRKKAVVVTALYTIQAAQRSAEEVLQSLFAAEKTAGPAPAPRHRPQHKQIWGTLAGKPAALDRLRQQVAKRDGAHIQQRVMLCDGDKSLQAHLRARFPAFTLILDFIHAVEYLWKAGNSLHGEGSDAALAWVTAQARRLLTGQLPALLHSLQQEAEQAERTKYQQKVLKQVAHYFERNQDYMQYATYLQRGWPIASGVIEGACRHFVKDRMELSGMRWHQDGAEQLLRLRAVAENGDWEAYHRFRKQRRQLRLYGSDWPPSMPLISAPSAAPTTSKAAAPILATLADTRWQHTYDQLPLVG